MTLRYIKEEQCWERSPESDVSYTHPDPSGQVRSFPRSVVPQPRSLIRCCMTMGSGLQILGDNGKGWSEVSLGLS